jgi:hypothetical protein
LGEAKADLRFDPNAMGAQVLCLELSKLVADAADLFVDGSPVEETYRWHCGPSYEALEIARERRRRGDRTFNPDAVSD